jgi:hypothetical protein
MVAVVLVVVGLGADKGGTVPAKITGVPDGQRDRADEPLPPVVTTGSIGEWLSLQQPTGPWARFKRQYVLAVQSPARPDARALAALRVQAAVLPEKLRPFFLADLDARANGKAAPPAHPADLLAALDEAERLGYFDPWLGAYLWRKTAAGVAPSEGRALVELYARLARHARLSNTLIRAQARVKPLLLPPRAWMSKAGPFKKGDWAIDRDKSLAEMLGAAKVLYAESDSGTWKRDGLAVVMVARGSAPVTLIRAGRRQPLEKEETFRFHRLDLVETPAGEKPIVLEHAWLGQVELPAGRVVSAWDLAGHLSAGARGKLRKEVAAALGGSEESAGRLERALPLAHQAIREGLAGSPSAPGAPRLRLILALFDDALSPAPADGEVAPRLPGKPAEPRGGTRE